MLDDFEGMFEKKIFGLIWAIFHITLNHAIHISSFPILSTKNFEFLLLCFLNMSSPAWKSDKISPVGVTGLEWELHSGRGDFIAMAKSHDIILYTSMKRFNPSFLQRWCCLIWRTLGNLVEFLGIWSTCARSKTPKWLHSTCSGELNFYQNFMTNFAFIQSSYHYKVKFGTRGCSKKSEYSFYVWL